MKRAFILEGPDGAGKSVLAHKLVEALNAKYTHHGPYTGQPIIAQHYLNSLVPALRDHHDVVLDRSWLSEPIYGGVFRGGANRITPIHERMLTRCAMACSTTVIICLPPVDTCLKNYRERKNLEYLDNEDQLMTVWKEYRNMLVTSMSFIRYDYTRDNVDVIVNRLRSIPVRNSGPGIGSFDPGNAIMLVSAEPGRVDLDVPFVTFDHKSVADWMTRQLERAHIPESMLYWVSAMTPWGDPTPADFVNVLKPKKIIALGNIATRWCLDNNLRFSVVPHPQFWKRFHSKADYSLIKELQS